MTLLTINLLLAAPTVSLEGVLEVQGTAVAYVDGQAAAVSTVEPRPGAVSAVEAR
jgi:hypothetical protein